MTIGPQTIEAGAGTCMGLGATNARIAHCEDGDISGFVSEVTPELSKDFFKWMARNLLESSHQGSQWLVAGFPGPVSHDGQTVGPLVNVHGMQRREYDLRQELIDADSEVGRVLEQGFLLLPVNDGALAAQAAASRVGCHKPAKTGALIFGTGVGAGVVEKDLDYTNVHRVDRNPLEIGHLLVNGQQSFETYEERFSGPGIQARYRQPPERISADHPLWEEVGVAVGTLSLSLGIMSGVELVVPTGGLGAGAAEKYGNSLEAFLVDQHRVANPTQRKFTPVIRFIPPSEANEFEMYGAEGVVRDHLTQPA